MPRHTTYYVQAIELRRKALVRGQLLPFKTEAEAKRRGEKMATTVPGVIVYSVEGDFDADDLEEPKVLATWGQVPEQD